MNEEKPNRLLQRIFEIRRAKKINLDKLAIALRVKTPEAASKIENGQVPLNANYLDDIAKLLGVRAWELFVNHSSGEIGPLNDQEKALILELKRITSETEREEALAMAIKLAGKFADAK